jgi:CheY-like chemotaxis protein
VPGHGSVFRVEAPLAERQAPAVLPRETPRTPAAPLAGLAVLAIDNDPTILEGMRTLLGGWGCQVVTAAGTREAMHALEGREDRPGVIIADYHLDEGNGLEAVAALRTRLAADVPAVLITADRSLALREEAEKAGVNVLNKPVKPAALRALLAQWRATRIAAE